MKPFALLMITLFSMLNSFAQKGECVRTTKFGEADICLKQVEGYQECYLEPMIKQLADMTEVQANMVLGFYLDDASYEQRDLIPSTGINNYFKVYGTKQIKDFKADESALEEMQKVLAGNFISKNWGDMKKEIDKVGLEVEIGAPTVIDSYKLNERSFTYILLAKYEFEGEESYVMSMTMNGMLINDRMVWMAYYLRYEGENTINQLRENSNIILGQLMD